MTFPLTAAETRCPKNKDIYAPHAGTTVRSFFFVGTFFSPSLLRASPIHPIAATCPDSEMNLLRELRKKSACLSDRQCFNLGAVMSLAAAVT